MDALYFRVSTERQTSENQFEDVLAEMFFAETRTRIDNAAREFFRQKLIDAIGREERDGKVRYRIDEAKANRLAEKDYIYIEHCSARGPRPRLDEMMRDAAMKRFDRVLVWKVSRLGRNMREVINTVYELSDLGITVVPVKSQTGPINGMMGKLLWVLQAWYAEFENSEREESIKAGLKRARAEGKSLGRPRRVFDREKVSKWRKRGLSWGEISVRMKTPASTLRRAYTEGGPK